MLLAVESQRTQERRQKLSSVFLRRTGGPCSATHFYLLIFQSLPAVGDRSFILLKGCFTFKINFSFHLFFLNSNHIHDPSKSLSPYSSFIILEVICYLLMKQTNKQKTIEFFHFEVFWDHYVASVYRAIMFFTTCKWVFWSLHWLLSY